MTTFLSKNNQNMVDIETLESKLEEGVGVCISQLNVCFRMPNFRTLRLENQDYFYIKTVHSIKYGSNRQN